jgi:hypothetical protein
MTGSNSRGQLNPEHEGVKIEKAKAKVQAHVTGRVKACKNFSRCPINDHLRVYL